MSTMRKGDEGPAVTLLQGVLKRLDHDIEVDGKFGKNTRAAVKAFQESSALKADGLVGKDTAWALVEALNLDMSAGFDFTDDDGSGAA